MWEISNALQLISFFRAIGLGVILCLLYDVFRVIRTVYNNSDLMIFIEDIIYFVIISPVVFLFLLATTNGEIRIYILVAVLIGFTVSRFTVSMLFFRVNVLILKAFTTAFSFLNTKISAVLIYLYEKINFLVLKAVNTCKKLLKKR